MPVRVSVAAVVAAVAALVLLGRWGGGSDPTALRRTVLYYCTDRGNDGRVGAEDDREVEKLE